MKTVLVKSLGQPRTKDSPGACQPLTHRLEGAQEGVVIVKEKKKKRKKRKGRKEGNTVLEPSLRKERKVLLLGRRESHNTFLHRST